MRRPDCPWRRPHGLPRASRGRHGGRARPRVFAPLNGSARTVTAWSTRARGAAAFTPTTASSGTSNASLVTFDDPTEAVELSRYQVGGDR